MNRGGENLLLPLSFFSPNHYNLISMKKVSFFLLIGLMPFAQAFCQNWLHLPTTNNNRIDIGNLAVVGDSITVEAMITQRNFSAPLDANDIISKHTNSSNCSYLFRPTDFAIQTTAGFTSVVNPFPLCYDSTYHVAATYDGDSLKYFLNGAKVAAKHHTGALFQNQLITGIGNVTGISTFNEQFIGYIDEVRIWKVARTQPEIAANMYNLPNPENQYGLMAYYKFEGNYVNLQGNADYNGVPSGSHVLNEANPLFNGDVDKTNCSITTLDLLKSPEASFTGQNFPNPFAAETVIPCFIPEQAKQVSLEIYGLDSRKILEVGLLERGYQKINIKGNMLPSSGMYMYCLVISNQRQAMKRMVFQSGK